MTRDGQPPIVPADAMLIHRWLTGSGFTPGERAPFEAIVLRCLGLAYLAVFLEESFTTRPAPGLHGRGAVVLAATIAFVAGVVAAQPARRDAAARTIAALALVTAASAVLAVEQPHGIWPAGAYFVGIVGALRLERMAGLLTMAGSAAVLVVVPLVTGRGGQVPSVLMGVVPWFLVMRLMRVLRDQRDSLAASRQAEARAAAEAERGRIAREMHDVLAHSLSALALQLESSRLVARERGADPEVARALDQAHHLAASGLQEARRAIAAARGEELPGPDRLATLAAEFESHSGLPVAVEVRGEPRELAPDARLAVYRTAQEALTNVRRHATPERVEVRLSYEPECTVLVIEDRSSVAAPPPVLVVAAAGGAAGGYGLTGMRERAELLGGELRAQPTEHGFLVELRLPA